MYIMCKEMLFISNELSVAASFDYLHDSHVKKTSLVRKETVE